MIPKAQKVFDDIENAATPKNVNSNFKCTPQNLNEHNNTSSSGDNNQKASGFVTEFKKYEAQVNKLEKGSEKKYSKTSRNQHTVKRMPTTPANNHKIESMFIPYKANISLIEGGNK